MRAVFCGPLWWRSSAIAKSATQKCARMCAKRGSGTMRADEKARLGRVLADAFDLGERIVARDGAERRAAIAARDCLSLAEVILASRRSSNGRNETRAELAHALVSIMALAGIVGLDDVLVDVDAIVRERETILEREG